MWNLAYLLKTVIFLYLIQEISSHFEFTNLKCTSDDEKFSEFEYCQLKSVNRTYKYAHVKVKLYQTPITKIKVNVALLKRFNGYRPFMYNITFDACRFLRSVYSSTPDLTIKYFYQFVETTSNMNHTCPFDHDLEIVLPISIVDNQLTKVLPFPGGDYMLETQWFAYDVRRAIMKVFGTVSYI
ncbi:uncharacterized protein Dana_GF27425 [Drosophila ananassae]|uniref:MD-2-related lipid-recognition domain-containing protein n=1 Tax=Drosophila ananassae TaxID=7217 RepID=A0A0N8P1K5_DROAN|nr:uncharacterized protein Dana_GF27425 [Drosophila ananassae]